MKYLKFILPVVIVTGLLGTGFNSLATSGRHGTEHKVNICHRTGSHSHPWEAIRVDSSAFDGQGTNDHTQHGDFLYGGPVKHNGHPTKDGNSWCEEHISQPSPSPAPSPSPSTSPSPSPSPVASPSPCVACGENNQTQTQENNQTVNITVESSGQVLGAKVPQVQPETGVSVLGLVTMGAVAPLGIALARFGRGRMVNGKPEENLENIASNLVKERTLKRKLENL